MHSGLRRFFRTGRGSLLGITIAVVLPGCAWVGSLPEIDPMRQAPASPSEIWKPDADQEIPTVPDSESLEFPLQQPGPAPTDLARIVEIALVNNPATRTVWNRARVEAARYAETRGQYYPRIDGGVSIGYRTRRFVQFTPELQEQEYGPFGELFFLLLDFGGRSADVEAARLTLLAANWEHNQAIQDNLFTTLRAYYIHVTARSALEAARANVADARILLAANQAQLEYGAGIRAQVLQAKSEFASAELEETKRAGEVEISLGNLVTAMGLPADTPLQIQAGTGDLPLPQLSTQVRALIDQAVEERPSLQAARAEVAARREEITRARSEALPRLSIDAFASQQWYIGECSACLDFFARGDRRFAGPGSNYAARMAISAPIFDGFARWNRIRESEAAAELAESEIIEQEREVAAQVWDAYYRLDTARKRVTAAERLLASARESYQINLSSFRVGATNNVAVVTAYDTLSRARMEVIFARGELRVALAALLRAVGTLSLTPPA